MNCYNFAFLEITDGTTTVNLIDERSGFLLDSWTPQAASYKGGGIFQNSPLAHGRRLVARRFDNVIETFQLKARHTDPDALIEETQELRRLLEKAADYWATDWQNTPVYIKARAFGESNTRYALIQTARLGSDNNPYAQPFLQPTSSRYGTVEEDVPLFVERGDWFASAPGTAASVAISSTQEWVTPADWEVETTTPVGDVTALLETANGDLYAGTDSTARLYKSTNGGATWALNHTFGSVAGDALNALLEATLGGVTYILAGVAGGSSVDGVHYSINNGSSWVSSGHFTSDVHSLWAPEYINWIHAGGSDGTSGDGSLYTTSGNIAAWNGRLSASIGAIRGITEIPSTGRIITIADDKIYSQTFDIPGLPGTNEVTHGSGTFRAILRLASERIIAGMDNGVVYYSDDDGATWTTATTTLTSGAYSFVQDSTTGVIYAGGSSRIWISYNDGDIWRQASTLPATTVKAMLQKANGDIYAGAASRILKLDSGKYTATTTHVINGHPIGEITHVKRFDNSGASFTTPFPGSTLPYVIWPSPSDSSDIVYVGISSAFGPFTFSNMVFNLTTPGVSINDNVALSYWNGATWTGLNKRDNTIGAQGSFSRSGQSSIVWEPPSNWATTTVDGVAGYWVRLHTWVYGTNPQQGTYDIYTMRNAYVEVAADAIGGDIPALLEMEIEVASDNDGVGGFDPDAYFNRVLCGLRSVSRGSRFQAYLNASDQGNDPAVVVTAGTDTTFAADIRTPSNRRMTYNPVGTGSWVNIATWTLQGDLVADYYGTFHCFLRGRQVGGTAGQILLRLVTSTGSGGVQITSQSKAFVNTSDHQFIDFGRITLPVSSLFAQAEQGDVATLQIQAFASSATPDAYLYDLVLLPVDEWAGDFTDKENSSTSPITGGYYLEVDSATFPKRSVRAQVRASSNDRIKAVYQPVVNGEAILQANSQQRIWFMFARTASAGSTDWRSTPWMSARITLAAQQRYLGMRGGR